MKVFEGASQIKEELRNPVMTIGNFDGVHLGHQELFNKIIKRARAIGGVSVVYTFDPHPLKVLDPDRFFPLITTREEKEKVIEWTGVDVLIREEFTREFSQCSTDEFVRNVICNRIHAQEVFIGPDYRFGKGRKGTTDLLKSLGEHCGLTVGILDNVKVDGIEVRSTMIRNYVLEGKVREAARFVDHRAHLSYEIEGNYVSHVELIDFLLSEIDRTEKATAEKCAEIAEQRKLASDPVFQIVGAIRSRFKLEEK